jgi:hypothetical protein
MTERSTAQHPHSQPPMPGIETAEQSNQTVGEGKSPVPTEHGASNLTAGVVGSSCSLEKTQCLRALYALSQSANEKFLVSAAKVDQFLEQYRSLPPGSAVKSDIATEINKKGVFLQTPILSACLAKISTHFVTLCDIASELLTSGYNESSKGNEVLILSQLVYCIGVGGDREKRILSALPQLSKIVDAFVEKNSIIDRYPDRVSAGWSNLIESFNILVDIPEPLAGSLYRALPSEGSTKISLVSVLPVIEEAPLSFFSYAPNANADTVATLAVHLLTLAKTPHEQRKVARILSARIEEFHKKYPSQENPFTQPLSDLFSQLDRDPPRGQNQHSRQKNPHAQRPLEVSTFVSLLKLSCTLLECGESKLFHQLCNSSSKRLLEVKSKTLLMTPLSDYPSAAIQEEAVRLRLKPLYATKGLQRAKVAQSVEALSFAAENFDAASLSRLFKTHLAPLVRGHVGLLGRLIKSDSVLTKEPDFTAAVSRVLEKLPQTKEVKSVQKIVEMLSRAKR